MLTKTLVKFRRQRNKIAPDFIDPECPDILAFAEQMITCFSEANGKIRAELEEEIKLTIEGYSGNSLFARGIEKLLFDRIEWNTDTDASLNDYRSHIFEETSRLFSSGKIATSEDLSTEIEATTKEAFDEIKTRLYSDLPENHEVKHFKKISPTNLLHRYNAALVQWMLLSCNSLTITLTKGNTGSLRQLFKYLRFRQLLARVERTKKGDFEITIDGPMNLFYQTKKYGMSLANFFPAVLCQETWKMRAEIQLKNQKPKTLELDESCGIKAWSRHFLAYIPDEIEMFAKLFSEKVSDWKIETANEFLPLSGDSYCFPDFVFINTNVQKTVYLELFHQWHAAQLKNRLEQLGSSDNHNLIIGAAKKLAKEDEMSTALDESGHFNAFGFLFRDMPTVDQVKKILGTLT